jgi:TonB-dependent SusC/RagA subfamily outer membrane receptor
MKHAIPALFTALILLCAASAGQAQTLSAPQLQAPAKPIRLACHPSLFNKQPLYVVDGIPLDSASQLARLNPNDIEEVLVLKGAEATALCGSRAQYGLIIITMKRKPVPKPYRQRPMEASVAP